MGPTVPEDQLLWAEGELNYFEFDVQVLWGLGSSEALQSLSVLEKSLDSNLLQNTSFLEGPVSLDEFAEIGTIILARTYTK